MKAKPAEPQLPYKLCVTGITVSTHYYTLDDEKWDLPNKITAEWHEDFMTNFLFFKSVNVAKGVTIEL